MAAVALATFAQVRGFGFIYDDYWTVVSNRHLERPLRELVAAALSGRSIEWNMPDATRPLMGLSLWLDRRLFGLWPGGHHLHSLALYALVCVLGFLLAFALLRRLLPALCAGLLFAVLPLHTEVAVAVNYREDLHAAIGVLGAALVCFWPAHGPWRWRSLACGLFWALGLFGKENALIAPLVVAALSLARRPTFVRSGATLSPGLVCASVAALWLSWRFGLSRLGEQIPTASYGSWTERLLRTARFEVIATYKSLLPLAPRPEREPLGPAHAGWVVALVIIVGAVVWLGRRRKTRVLGAALALSLVAPLCTSPLLAPLNELADRYWFVGSLASALVVGWGASTLGSPRAWAPAAAMLIGACAFASWKASTVWASEVNLWTFVAQTAPGSARGWTSLSRVHRLASQEALARRTLERALWLAPEHAPALAGQVLNALWFGQLAAARAELRALEGRRVHGGSLRVARHCALMTSAAAAQVCVRRAVPPGLVLGDVEHLRAVSERLLGVPAVKGPSPQSEAPRDAGSSADAAAAN